MRDQRLGTGKPRGSARRTFACLKNVSSSTRPVLHKTQVAKNCWKTQHWQGGGRAAAPRRQQQRQAAAAAQSCYGKVEHLPRHL